MLAEYSVKRIHLMPVLISIVAALLFAMPAATDEGSDALTPLEKLLLPKQYECVMGCAKNQRACERACPEDSEENPDANLDCWIECQELADACTGTCP